MLRALCCGGLWCMWFTDVCLLKCSAVEVCPGLATAPCVCGIEEVLLVLDVVGREKRRGRRCDVCCGLMGAPFQFVIDRDLEGPYFCAHARNSSTCLRSQPMTTNPASHNILRQHQIPGVNAGEPGAHLDGGNNWLDHISVPNMNEPSSQPHPYSFVAS